MPEPYVHLSRYTIVSLKSPLAQLFGSWPTSISLEDFTYGSLFPCSAGVWKAEFQRPAGLVMFQTCTFLRWKLFSLCHHMVFCVCTLSYSLCVCVCVYVCTYMFKFMCLGARTYVCTCAQRPEVSLVFF